MADSRKVLAEALVLQARERLRIAGLVAERRPEGDEDAIEAWVAELDRRSASLENGTAQLIDAAAAHAHVRDALKARRASRR